MKAESTNLVFETSAGNLECTSNTIEGTVGNNGAKKDAGNITAEKSSGGEPGGLCKTTTPFGAAEDRCRPTCPGATCSRARAETK